MEASNPIVENTGNVLFFTIVLAAIATLATVIYIYRVLAKRTVFVEDAPR